MKLTIKILRPILEEVRRDLIRPHPFAHERVGFLLAGASETAKGLLFMISGYQSVADDDYEHNDTVGAQIGSNAMRKAVQAAYRPQRALLHVHTHGGSGRPGFSSVDLRSSRAFVPGFSHPIPKMPHGLLVLSNDSAYGLCWLGSDATPIAITDFITVGAPYARRWRTV